MIDDGADLIGAYDTESTNRILVVDDSIPNVRLLTTVLNRAGYDDVLATTHGKDVLRVYETERPDIILLDLHMPDANGWVLTQQLRELCDEPFLPIIVVTGDDSAEARRHCLRAGASDFVTKPFDPSEITLRVRNLLEIRRLHLALARENRTLEERVRERTEELTASRIEVLDRLAAATEIRDDVTGHHTRRVGALAGDLALHLGTSDAVAELIRRAAPLHDIGKIAIPDQILRKPGPLTPEEYDVIKTHTTIGASILAGGDNALIVTAERIAMTHHERWDGSGYPRGLVGDAIPLDGRIVAVADFYDALVHDRPYRAALDSEVVLNMIRQRAGTQFESQVAEAILDLAQDERAARVLHLE
jgi:putative two-component system response regulator